MAAQLRSSPFSAKSSPRGRRPEDSPSRQLNWDLDRALGQLQIHESESAKLHAYQKRQQQEDLDAQEAAQAQAHLLELTAAQAQHEVVRSQAEAVLQAYLQAEKERRQREEEERRHREEEERRRQAAEEARRKAEEERKAREQQARREQEDRERQEAEQRAQEKNAADERHRQEREAAERKARDEKAQADRQAVIDQQRKDAETPAPTVKPAPVPAPATTRRPVGPDPQIEIRHKEYLALHKKLKVFRKEFWASAKDTPVLKDHVGDMRRAMRGAFTMLTVNKKNRSEVLGRVQKVLSDAMKSQAQKQSSVASGITHPVVSYNAPMVPVNEFLPAHLNLGDDNKTLVPALVIFLLSYFSKSAIANFATECVTNLPAAENLGVLIAHVFSHPSLQFPRANATSPHTKQQSLIPILMCKFHAIAPILFGISGPENTQAGRVRLGWRRLKVIETDAPGEHVAYNQKADYDRTKVAAQTAQKAYIPPSIQYDRLYGLAAGYAALTLRNFGKGNRQPPMPPSLYWTSLAYILNTPTQEVHMCHLMLLKGLLENDTFERFVLYFGAAGIAVLRQAVVEFPKSLPRELHEKPVVKAISLFVEVWKKEKWFSIA